MKRRRKKKHKNKKLARNRQECDLNSTEKVRNQWVADAAHGHVLETSLVHQDHYLIAGIIVCNTFFFVSSTEYVTVFHICSLI